MARILSISYDAVLLATRELLLMQMGHEVISAEGFAPAYEACEARGGRFDLIVLGHSIPHADKVAIIKHCVHSCSCPVLALLRPNEGPVEGAQRSIDSGDPRAVMAAVEKILKTATHA